MWGRPGRVSRRAPAPMADLARPQPARGPCRRGAVASGRRTASAFPRFLARYGSDLQVYNFPGASAPGVDSLPNVSSIYYEPSYDNGAMVANGPVVPEADSVYLESAQASVPDDKARGGTDADRAGVLALGALLALLPATLAASTRPAEALREA